jgi:hypothetical protein
VVIVTTAPTSTASSSSKTSSSSATSSYNLIEQMIQRQAKAISASSASTLSVTA